MIKFSRIIKRLKAWLEWRKMQAKHKAVLNRIKSKHGKRSHLDKAHKREVTNILRGNSHGSQT